MKQTRPALVAAALAAAALLTVGPTAEAAPEAGLPAHDVAWLRTDDGTPGPRPAASGEWFATFTVTNASDSPRTLTDASVTVTSSVPGCERFVRQVTKPDERVAYLNLAFSEFFPLTLPAGATSPELVSPGYRLTGATGACTTASYGLSLTEGAAPASPTASASPSASPSASATPRDPGTPTGTPTATGEPSATAPSRPVAPAPVEPARPADDGSLAETGGPALLVPAVAAGALAAGGAALLARRRR